MKLQNYLMAVMIKQTCVVFNEKTNGDNHMNLNDYKPFLHR